jgi:hypothetical protein
MIFKAENPPQSGSLGSMLGGVTYLVDGKTCAAGTRYSTPSTNPCGVIKIREENLRNVFFRQVHAFDMRTHSTPSGQVGPIEQELREYGHSGRVLGSVIGCYDGGSIDLGKHWDLAATELARKCAENHSMPMPQAGGMSKRQLNRGWGHHIARGRASLLLGRLRDFAGSPEADDEFLQPSAHHFDPDSAAARARWTHANGHQGANDNTHGCRA